MLGDEADLVADIEAFEVAARNAVAMEVDLVAVGGKDEAAVAVGQQPRDPAVVGNGVQLDLAAPRSRMILEQPPRRVERVADRDMDILMRVPRRRVATDDDLPAGDRQVDAHAEQVSLLVAAVAALDDNAAADDAVEEPLEFCGAPANSRLQCRRGSHVPKRDLKRELHCSFLCCARRIVNLWRAAPLMQIKGKGGVFQQTSPRPDEARGAMAPTLETLPAPPSETIGPAAKMISVVDSLVAEIDPVRRPRATLDSRLDRDLGIDSLGRAELVARVERAFGVSLPERILGEAETPRDLLAAVLARQGVAENRPRLAAVAAAVETVAVPGPAALPTLPAVLDWHAREHADRPHIILEEGGGASAAISYGELRERACRAGGALRELGVAPDDRVAIMLPTGEDFFIAFFGILYAGAIPVPIYPPAGAAQLEDHLRRQAGILDNAGASVLIAAPILRTPATLLHSLVDNLGRVVSVAELADPGTTPLPHVERTEATALLQYTSGSTGEPKGVILSHGNILANIRAMGEAIAASSADVFVSWLPLYHDMGLIGAWLACLYHGAPFVVLPPQNFQLRPESWLWATHRHRGTLSAAPNFAFELCLRRIEDAAIEGLDLSSLRLVANGSEAVSASTLRRFAERFAGYGFRAEAMAAAYGLAESAVALTVPPPGRGPAIDRISRRSLEQSGIAEPAAADISALELVGCGHPLPGHEVRVVDDTGHELGERHEGRVQFRGPAATAGYFRNAAKTRELFSGGWLETGDRGYFADGELFITGRTKDLIIRAGRNIYPAEIEAALGELPGLQPGGVAAFGSHDPDAGTERLVILAETTAAPAEHGALRERIAAAAVAVLETPPEEVVLVPPHSIPKTASGKVRRTAARDLYESGNLGRAGPGLWRQVFRLVGAALRPGLRRIWRTAGALLFAIYWWAVTGLLAPLVWLLVVVLPKRHWRWAALRAAGRTAFRLTGTTLAVGREGDPPQPAIVVCNHSSYIDGLVLALALPGDLAFVAKRELVRQPIARVALRALGTLFVERSDAEQGIEDIRHAADAARRSGGLVFFPEGTLTRMPGLLPFRLGAFAVAAQTGLPIVPVAIRGTRSILRGGQWFPRRGAVRVTIGEAIRPQGAAFADAVRLREASRAAMLKLCGEPDLAAR